MQTRNRLSAPRAVLGAAVLLAGLAPLLGGCIKVKLTLRMNEDGTGHVTEELVFGEKLVNVSRRLGPSAEGQALAVPSIESATSDDYVRQRVANMGEGVTLASRKVENLPDGSVRMVCVYNYQDISKLRLSPIPYGFGWEKYYLQFNLGAPSHVDPYYILHARLGNLTDPAMRGKEADNPPLSELEAQQVRALLPIFKDMLEGFELLLKVEIFDHDQWASATKGHPTSYHLNRIAMGGGRLTLYHVTDQDLVNSDDGLLMVVPWRQTGREVDLVRLMPHVNDMYHDLRDQGFAMSWRAFETPHGREYY